MADVSMTPADDSSTSIPITLPPDVSMNVVLASFDHLPPQWKEQISHIQLTEQLILNPTPTIINTLYKVLIHFPPLLKDHEDLEKIKAEKEQRDAEVESALNEAERLRSEAHQRFESQRLQKEELEKQYSQVYGKVASLESELNALKSSNATQSGGLADQNAEFKARLESVEEEKRGLLNELEREKIESNRRGDEIQTLSTVNKELRQSESRLTTELQEARSAEGLSKFKIQSLEQELALARKDSEWAHTELTNTTNSASQFRTTSHSELVKLQSELDTALQTNASLTSKANSLQSAYDSCVSRLNESNDKLTDLQNRFTSAEESFTSEMNTQQRLNNLLERRAQDSQKRVNEIEGEWEEVLKQCREREEVAREETQEEKARSDRLESEKNELQIALDRLAESVGIETQIGGLGRSNGNGNGNGLSNNGSVPGTPLRGSNQLPSATQMMSPTAALAGKVQKSGMSFTQIYASLARTEEELRRERVEREKVEQILADVEAEILDRAPILEARQQETERLSLELEEMSSHFARACQEKDQAEQASENRRLELQKIQRENDIMSQQLADSGRQVRHLMREALVREDPSAAQRLEPDGSELPDPTLGGNQIDEDETQAIITSQLVTFSSLTDLCAQNARLLRVTRELGSRMEKEEEDYKARLARNESEAVQEASRVIQRLNEALRSEKNVNESLKREKDMFRSMASTGRGRAVSGTGLGAQSPGNAGGLFGPSANNDEFNARQQELARSYTQLQNQFDAFKTETATDTERLKNDVFEARREAGQATIAAAREKGAKENAEERLLTLQGTFELQKNELNEIIKQKNSLQNNLTRRDLAAHEVEEQLQKTRAQLEILRNESANLRAEKEIFKSTENRLLLEKKTLEEEKRSLNDFLKNMQNMSNEIEKENSINKRRLENQVNGLEENQKDLKTKLNKAESSLSEINLRKEVEVKDLQTRLDKLNSELSNVKEQFAISKTNESHLNSKVEDLQKSLDTKEEKLAVYERRVANAAAINANANGNGQGDNADALSREQTLEIELADLRGDLRAAQVEAEQARSHTEQFKSIAQSVEDALNELKTSSDTYREEMERERTEKEAEVQSLHSRLEVVGNELTTAQNESSQLRQEIESQRTTFASEKRSLEDALAEMTGVEDRVNAAQEDIKKDLKTQIQLTREAHNKYEAELVAHAEDVKKLSNAKENLSKKDGTIRELTIQSETAIANLTNSEASWKNQKETLEKEIGELTKRIEDLSSQNAILHSHLETASSQANQIRQAASQTQSAADGDTSMSGSPNEELHEVIKYLRREKEIAELQIDVNKQESARLRQSLEHANHSLDEVRTTLAEERSRNAGAASSAEQHAALLEKINQVSILRESNVTLREEAERSQSRANRLDQLLATSQAEIEPLKDQLRNLNVELEASQAQVKLLQEDNTRWQARAQSILQQYNRIDPEELKALEERAQTAESARDSIRNEMQLLVDQATASQETNRAEMQVQIDTAQAGKVASDERFQKLQQQIRERLKAKDETAAKLQGEKEGLEKELKSLRDQQSKDQASISSEVQNQENKMAELRAERDRAIEEKAQAEKSVEANQKKIQELEEQVKTAQSQLSNSTATATEGGDVAANSQALEAAKAAWEEEKKKMEEKLATHLQRAKDFLKNQKEAEASRDSALAKLAEVEKAQSQQPQAETSVASGSENAATVSALQQRVKELEEALTKANATVEELRTQLAANPSSGTTGSSSEEIEQLKKDHEVALQSQQSDLSERFQKQQKAAVDIAVSRFKNAPQSEDPQARQAAIDEAVKAALDLKKKEWEDSIQEKIAQSNEDGKKEANLRNGLMISKKDKEIKRLTDQIASLQGDTTSTTSTPSTPSVRGAATGGISVRPAPLSVRGRGAATSSPVVSRPTASTLNTTPATTTTTTTPATATAAGTAVRGSSIRGRGSGIATRGGRGGLAAAAAAAAAASGTEGTVGQKRKLEGAQGTNAGAGAAKRGRPAVNKGGN